MLRNKYGSMNFLFKHSLVFTHKLVLMIITFKFSCKYYYTTLISCLVVSFPQRPLKLSFILYTLPLFFLYSILLIYKAEFY